MEKKLLTSKVAVVFKIIYLLAVTGLIIGASIWGHFFIQGYFTLGHLPTYGDPEIVSFDGIDRQMVIYSLVTMFYGMLTFIILTIVDLINRFKIVNSTVRIIGIFSLFLDILVIYSDQAKWLLD